MTMRILKEENRDGAEITIYWNTVTNTTEVWIVPHNGESFGFDAGENGVLALDIFEHPYFYQGILPTIQDIERTREIGAFA